MASGSSQKKSSSVGKSKDKQKKSTNVTFFAVFIVVITKAKRKLMRALVFRSTAAVHKTITYELFLCTAAVEPKTICLISKAIL